MDTQIRPVWSTPVVVAPSGRAALSTFSLPARTTAPIAPAKDGTASQLREAILRCATEAQAEEKTDTEARLHSFIAKLSGSMECLGEDELDHALWDLMKMHAEPVRRQQPA